MRALESLSVVIPCHNEEEVIQDSYKRLSQLLQEWHGRIISDYEIVMVNNGSTDQTLQKMLAIQERGENVVIVDLRKNFGYQGSITSGLFHASKNMIVSIDADLQDDPSKISDMVLKYYEGYEMVLGVRINRESDSVLKKSSAQLYYRFLNALGIKSEYNHGDFRLLSRSLVDELKTMGERNRYLRGMIFELESRYACVYYQRAMRPAGRTKFNFSNLFALAVDGITSFSNVPLRLIPLMGIFMFAVSLIGFLFVVYMKYISGVDVPGWASIVVAVLFFGGIQNLSVGILGEYVAKIYVETKQRPLFLVRRVYKKKASGEGLE